MLFPARDGDPHLVINVGSTTFVWQGKGSIYVCSGGYGEPVMHIIGAPESMRRASYSNAARIMASVVNQFLNPKEES